MVGALAAVRKVLCLTSSFGRMLGFDNPKLTPEGLNTVFIFFMTFNKACFHNKVIITGGKNVGLSIFSLYTILCSLFRA